MELVEHKQCFDGSHIITQQSPCDFIENCGQFTQYYRIKHFDKDQFVRERANHYENWVKRLLSGHSSRKFLSKRALKNLRYAIKFVWNDQLRLKMLCIVYGRNGTMVFINARLDQSYIFFPNLMLWSLILYEMLRFQRSKWKKNVERNQMFLQLSSNHI